MMQIIKEVTPYLAIVLAFYYVGLGLYKIVRYLFQPVKWGRIKKAERAINRMEFEIAELQRKVLPEMFVVELTKEQVQRLPVMIDEKKVIEYNYNVMCSVAYTDKQGNPTERNMFFDVEDWEDSIIAMIEAPMFVDVIGNDYRSIDRIFFTFKPVKNRSHSSVNKSTSG
jgi:hypothetical protein